MPPTRKTTPLQEKLIVVLAEALPSATLTGGAALAAFYTRQRATRDIDLFFHGIHKLDEVQVRVGRDAVAQHTDRILPIQTSPSFVRFEADAADERVVIDLVASPVPTIEPPAKLELLGVSVQVDTAREILVNKVVALLSRSELRDLYDVRALAVDDGTLLEAVAHASKKDAGFSPLTLAWVLRGLPIARLAKIAGSTESDVEGLVAFRDAFVTRLLDSFAADSRA